jgi:hypothetical protein
MVTRGSAIIWAEIAVGEVLTDVLESVHEPQDHQAQDLESSNTGGLGDQAGCSRVNKLNSSGHRDSYLERCSTNTADGDVFNKGFLKHQKNHDHR